MISCLKQAACLTCAAAAALLLSGCGEIQPAAIPTEVITLPTAHQETQPTTDPDKNVTHLEVVMEAGQLYTLDSYPNLQSVDLSGSTCYSAILDFAQRHPDLEVLYTVDMGGSVISNQDSTATLPSGGYTLEALLENLAYLPKLTTLSLPGMNLSAQQVEQLLQAYPELNLDYTVTLFGTAYSQDTTTLDLTAMTTPQVEEAAQKLGLLTNLTDVELSSSLTIQDVALLQESAPRISFHYSFELFGKTISTTDEEIIFKNQAIGNQGEADIRQALPILDGCQRFVLDNCQIDSEVLAKIREDFRDGPKVVWRVFFGVDGRYNLLTDAETLRAVYNVTDKTCGPMKYCEDVKYMDIGHNEQLTDLSFVGYMPNIEVLIASGCAVEELVGFENCKKLTWLELASCGKLKNIDSLAGCESLTYLNICYTKVTDLMPLDTLPLKRFVYLKPRVSTEEQNTFVAIHDGCRSVFYGYSNPWTPWRYDDNGKTYNAYYKDVVRKAFNYDELEKYLPKTKK